MSLFNLQSEYKPTGDQPQAIQKLTANLKNNLKHQVLLGVTGSGKTFSLANVIQNIQKPTLVVSHNKTLAAQLADEMAEFFPDNAVHYFVSYYDYYQPEAYIPRTDTYIEKETSINEEIDRLRHAATQSLLSRQDVIIVASVSCIYGLGSPQEYRQGSLTLKIGDRYSPLILAKKMTELQYERNDIDFRRGRFRIKGDILDIYQPFSLDEITRIEFFGNKIDSISVVDYITGREKLQKTQKHKNTKTSHNNCGRPPALAGGTAEPTQNEIIIFPATHYLAPEQNFSSAIKQIRRDLRLRIDGLKKQKKELEAHRINQRTLYDLEMIENTGYCNGIENYSRYFDGRKSGQPPYVLIDFFPSDFLLFIDESHMTIPQIRGMYAGDRARKENLINYGFRLPAALDNRPLKFDEFVKKINQVIYTSATPGPYEMEQITYQQNKKTKNKNNNVGAPFVGAQNHKQQSTRGRAGALAPAMLGPSPSGLVEQIIRPTGLLDPTIEIKPTRYQIDNLIEQIKKRVDQHQRVLITTLTKKMAEDLSSYLQEMNIKAYYLHSEIDTMQRLDILKSLRLGEYDVVVGINLLREGLDLPEVSLIAILDADKEGFLRSETAFVQTIGRAARHIQGHVIMYADKITGSMKRAIAETERRRKIQKAYNKKHGITPRGIQKAVKESKFHRQAIEDQKPKLKLKDIPQSEIEHIIKELADQMELAAQNLEFEKAAQIRDQIVELKKHTATN